MATPTPFLELIALVGSFHTGIRYNNISSASSHPGWSLGFCWRLQQTYGFSIRGDTADL